VLFEALDETLRRTKEHVIDRLSLYRAGMSVIGNLTTTKGIDQLNNMAKNIHKSSWRREKAMLTLRKICALQKCASFYASMHNFFNHENFKHDCTVALAERRKSQLGISLD
jgi:transposase-like protein